MELSVRIECDSVAPSGARLTTFVATYPRIILCEVNTHRALSRNSASSRAMPVGFLRRQVEESPFIPWHWGRNQRGMQAGEPLSEATMRECRRVWLAARDHALRAGEALEKEGLHKQIANRLLEPFSWVTSVISATEWSNFFSLRCHPAAEPHFCDLAIAMADLYYSSVPRRVGPGAWHLPFIREDELGDPAGWIGRSPLGPEADAGIPMLAKISAARCARVSYRTHEGVCSWEKDIELYDKLTSARPAHASPLEHVATPLDTTRSASPRSGNFHGWEQLRKRLPGDTDDGFDGPKLALRCAEIAESRGRSLFG